MDIPVQFVCVCVCVCEHRFHLFGLNAQECNCQVIQYLQVQIYKRIDVFIEVQLIYNIILISGIQHSNSVFLQIILIKSYYKIIGIISLCCTNTSLLLIYFIHSSLYQLIYTHILLLLPSLYSLVTTGLLSISVSLFLFCYTQSLYCLDFTYK